jgi:hypothetical protein
MLALMLRCYSAGDRSSERKAAFLDRGGINPIMRDSQYMLHHESSVSL